MNTLTRKKKLHKQLFLNQIIFSILKKKNAMFTTFFTTLSQQIISGKLLRVVIVDQKVI